MTANKKIASSSFQRSLKLLKMAGRIVGTEMQSAISRSPEGVQKRVAQAKTLTDSLSELKGAAMKVGQLLSIDLSDYLPPEAIEALKTLQDQSEPVAFETMKKVMISELGEAKFNQIHFNSTEPISSASIGQVYKVEINGQPVALKVQYPGIQNTVRSDIKILRRVITPLLLMSQRRMNLDAVFEEMQSLLEAETDYLQELTSLTSFKSKLGPHTNYIVPDALPDFSSAKVLAMSFHEGPSLQKWIDSSPPEDLRQSIGNQFLDLFEVEFFQLGLVQTDPNFANFKVDPTTDKLVLLDFGATKEYTPEFRAQYIRLLSEFNKDPQLGLTESFKQGLLDQRESKEAVEKYLLMMEHIMKPFVKTDGLFKFNDEDYSKQARKFAWDFVNELKFSPPPRKLLFLHRKLGGIFNALKALNVEIDVRPMWSRILNYKVK